MAPGASKKCWQYVINMKGVNERFIFYLFMHLFRQKVAVLKFATYCFYYLSFFLTKG